MIEAQDVCKSYGPHHVLDGASITVAPGEIVLLTGGNGSGKTTLLHVMMGLRRPDTGGVMWQQRTLTDAGAAAWRRARQAWGFLPQQVNLPSNATAGQLLRHHARLRRADVADAQRWLERVGLTDACKQQTAALSGGMRQRLAIALTLFHKPELIVMDEPDSSLDPSWRGELAKWLNEASQRGAAVLVTSQLNGMSPPHARHVHCDAGRLIEHANEHKHRHEVSL